MTPASILSTTVAFKSHGHNHLSGGMKRTNNWKNDIELTEDFQVVQHFISNVPGWSTVHEIIKAACSCSGLSYDTYRLIRT